MSEPMKRKRERRSPELADAALEPKRYGSSAAIEHQRPKEYASQSVALAKSDGPQDKEISEETAQSSKMFPSGSTDVQDSLDSLVTTMNAHSISITSIEGTEVQSESGDEHEDSDEDDIQSGSSEPVDDCDTEVKKLLNNFDVTLGNHPSIKELFPGTTPFEAFSAYWSASDDIIKQGFTLLYHILKELTMKCAFEEYQADIERCVGSFNNVMHDLYLRNMEEFKQCALETIILQFYEAFDHELEVELSDNSGSPLDICKSRTIIILKIYKKYESCINVAEKHCLEVMEPALISCEDATKMEEKILEHCRLCESIYVDFPLDEFVDSVFDDMNAKIEAFRGLVKDRIELRHQQSLEANLNLLMIYFCYQVTSLPGNPQQNPFHSPSKP